MLTFQGNVTFVENEAEYGGAQTLYENVSMIVGHFAKEQCAFYRSGILCGAHINRVIPDQRRRELFWSGTATAKVKGSE